MGQSVTEIAVLLGATFAILAVLFVAYELLWASDSHTSAVVVRPTTAAPAVSATQTAAPAPDIAALTPAASVEPVAVRSAIASTISPSTQRQLIEDALLTTGDLPGGAWQRAVVDGSQVSDTWYCDPRERFASEQIGAIFADTSGQHLLVTEGVSFLPDGGAADQLQRLRVATAGCDEMNTTDGGQPISFTIAPRSLAALGDDSYALAITSAHIQGQSRDVGGLAILIRRGDFVTALLDLLPGALDSSDAEVIAQAADARLISVQRRSE